MLMDHFKEEVVTKRNNSLNRVLYMFSWLLIIAGAILAVFMLNLTISSVTYGAFNPVFLIFALLSGGAAIVSFIFHDRLITEYEYTFTNGSLDFAEVYNNKKRKSLGSLNVRTVDAFGKVSSNAFQRFLNMPNIQKYNWFLNRDAELYFFYFTKDVNKKMIIFEPSEEMVDYVKQYLPRGIFINDNAENHTPIPAHHTPDN